MEITEMKDTKNEKELFYKAIVEMVQDKIEEITKEEEDFKKRYQKSTEGKEVILEVSNFNSNVKY